LYVAERSHALDDLKGEIDLPGADYHLTAAVERPFEHHVGELVVHPALQRPAHRTGAELWLEALLGQQFDRLCGELELDALRLETLSGPIQE
jgi:hypothetical protein